MTGRREARYAGFLLALTVLAACNFERGGLVAAMPAATPGGEGEGATGGPTRGPGAPVPVPAPPVVVGPDASAPATTPPPVPTTPPPTTPPAPGGSPDAKPVTPPSRPPSPPDAAPVPVDTAPPVAAECVDNTLRQPVQFTSQRGAPGGDLTFDNNGFMVSLDGRDIVRMSRGGRPEMVLANVLPPFNRGGGIDGLGMLPDGTVVVTDTNGDSLVLSNGQRNQRRSVDINAPGKVLLAPNGSLFVTGAQNGELFSFEPGTGRTTVLAMTDGRLRGLTYSLDFKTLYISDSKNRVLLAAKLRPDGTVEPPQVWVRGTGVFPDGLTTDICGNVYVADNAGGPLMRVTPGGKMEMVSALDHNDLAGLAFGSGKQGWDDHTLYAVSSHQGLTYEIRLGVRGAPLPPFTISQ
jgi:hypothetical protein